MGVNNNKSSYKEFTSRIPKEPHDNQCKVKMRKGLDLTLSKENTSMSCQDSPTPSIAREVQSPTIMNDQS